MLLQKRDWNPRIEGSNAAWQGWRWSLSRQRRHSVEQVSGASYRSPHQYEAQDGQQAHLADAVFRSINDGIIMHLTAMGHHNRACDPVKQDDADTPQSFRIGIELHHSR